jgi:DNA-binding transcriptional ArsR family regulator
MLEALFRSRVVIKLISYFMKDIKRECYLREVSREIDEPASAVQREIQKLEEFGLVTTRRKGNHRYFAIKEDFPLLPEIKGLFLKSEGIIDYLQDCFEGLEGVQLAFIYGDFAKKPSMTAEIGIIVIGQPGPKLLERMINSIQATLRRKVSCSVYGPDEFGSLLEKQDPELNKVLGGEKIILVANVAERATV